MLNIETAISITTEVAKELAFNNCDAEKIFFREIKGFHCDDSIIVKRIYR